MVIDRLMMLADILSGFSLFLLAYVGLLALFARMRDRRLERARFTLNFIAQTNILEKPGVDYRDAELVFADHTKSHDEYTDPADDNYRNVMKMLGIFEVISSSIRRGILDDDVMFDALGNDFSYAFNHSRSLIDRHRQVNQDPAILSDFEAISRRWADRRGGA